MKVDINKLMKYPSRASEDLGTIDFTNDRDIDAYVEEIMIINEKARIEELPMDESTLESRLSHLHSNTPSLMKRKSNR